MSFLTENFGSMLFNDAVMREKLPSDTYKSLKQTIQQGKDLDITVANSVANAMKDWAIEKGATHFTHWFQPMTGITAEKHDSFLHPQSNGQAITEFKGKNLIKGEPDASSFPSGGLRATFEARGYTAWDPTSYAFLKDDTLCIPTVFCSYSGEMLDKKTPLLRSNEALSNAAVRVLNLLGNPATRVVPNSGAEQEYFLIDKELWKKRKDLKFTGRTLYGAPPPKGQELDDHYFGAIKPRVKAFMYELNKELWKLGIYAYTEHNEAAPAQHELAPVFSTTNVAADQNQLTMEIMKKVADRHGLVCLLHEKPFQGVNGSGKHNNWSIATNTGENLFEPTSKPYDNTQFLLFLVAVIVAVDEYQDLLRMAVASSANDHRLGAHEAPPAIVSMYLGEELTAILECIESGRKYSPVKKSTMVTGVHVLPDFQKDTTDRNRTSPFAFTGNKFEFRMVGSSQSISDTSTILNTIMAEVLSRFADKLEGKRVTESAARRLIKEAFSEHKRIVFNGNNYSDEWTLEAAKRGLYNLKTAADAIPYIAKEKNIKLFENQGIFTRTEVISRCEIMLENYCKNLRIEALTMIDMARSEILPSIVGYTKHLSQAAVAKKELGIPFDTEKEVSVRLSSLAAGVYTLSEALEEKLEVMKAINDTKKRAEYCRDELISNMNELRRTADAAEPFIADRYRTFPTYGELLFGV